MRIITFTALLLLAMASQTIADPSKTENSMVAYLIVDLDIHDSVGFEVYRQKVPSLLAKHGGRYLVRGGQFEVIEGTWRPHRLVMFRFPDRAAIRALFADPEYVELMAVRKQTAKSDIIAVDGID